jgi:molybdopterin-guanine dinucleotide biosynthesis protein
MKKIISKFWNWVLGKTTVDEKVVATVKETKKRVKAIKEEIKDVADAVKEVGNQAGDIADAVKGKARKGRKKKNVK